MGFLSRLFGNVNRINRATGKGALHEAAQCGDLDKVKSLLAEGALIDLRSTTEGATPLHYAAESGYLAVAQYLVSHGASVNATPTLQRQGNTPLLIAATKGHLDLVRFLLEQGADPNITNADGSTPLFMAAQRGHTEAVKRLLNAVNKANPNVTTNRGAIALHVAAEHGFTEIASLLLTHGSDVDRPTIANGDTPLHDASLYGHEGIVDLLLERRADPNRQEHRGNTALHLSAYGGFPGIVGKLLAKGAKANIKSNAGFTPAELACDGPSAEKNLKQEIVSLLKQTKVKSAARSDSAAEPPEFLAPLSKEEKVAVSNQDPGVYQAMIMSRRADVHAVHFDLTSSQFNVGELLSRLSISDLERLAESVSFTIRADEASNTDLAQAAELYKKAFELNPFDDIAIMSYGVALAMQGSVREGIKWIEQALEVNPNSERARRQLEGFKSYL